MNNAAPVGVPAVPAALNERGFRHALRNALGLLGRGRTAHLHGNEFGHALAVLDDAEGLLEHHMVQSGHKVIPAFAAGRKLHAGGTVRHYQAGVIRAHVAVDGNAVERVLHSVADNGLQMLTGHSGIRADQTNHGRHAGGNHPRPLATGTDAHRFTADGELHGHLLLPRIAGDDGGGDIMPLLGGQVCAKLRKARLNAHHGHGKPDHAGGAHGHLLLAQAQFLCHNAALTARDIDTGSPRAGVGVTAVGHDGADIPARQVFPTHAHAGGTYSVCREGTGRGRRLRGIDKSQVQPRGRRLLDAAAESVGHIPLGSRHAATDFLVCTLRHSSPIGSPSTLPHFPRCCKPNSPAQTEKTFFPRPHCACTHRAGVVSYPPGSVPAVNHFSSV